MGFHSVSNIFFPLPASSGPPTPFLPAHRKVHLISLPRNLLQVFTLPLGWPGGVGTVCALQMESLRNLLLPQFCTVKHFIISSHSSWQAAWAPNAFSLPQLACLDCILQTLFLYRLEADKPVHPGWACPSSDYAWRHRFLPTSTFEWKLRCRLTGHHAVSTCSAFPAPWPHIAGKLNGETTLEIIRLTNIPLPAALPTLLQA